MHRDVIASSFGDDELTAELLLHHELEHVGVPRSPAKWTTTGSVTALSVRVGGEARRKSGETPLNGDRRPTGRERHGLATGCAGRPSDGKGGGGLRSSCHRAGAAGAAGDGERHRPVPGSEAPVHRREAGFEAGWSAWRVRIMKRSLRRRRCSPSDAAAGGRSCARPCRAALDRIATASLAGNERSRRSATSHRKETSGLSPA